jgi:hypothetical protein
VSPGAVNTPMHANEDHSALARFHPPWPDRAYEEGKAAGRCGIGRAPHVHTVLIKEFEQIEGVAVGGASVADLRVAAVPSRIDDHLGNFMTEGVSVNFFVRLIVDRVVVVGNGQVLPEY